MRPALRAPIGHPDSSRTVRRGDDTAVPPRDPRLAAWDRLRRPGHCGRADRLLWASVRATEAQMARTSAHDRVAAPDSLPDDPIEPGPAGIRVVHLRRRSAVRGAA